MKKVAFIIPSYFSEINQKEYKNIGKVFTENGYNVIYFPIAWKRKTMSDYISQFAQIYKRYKADSNVVFGFSFGAMIALLTSKILNPNALILASLSPYFAEDLANLDTTDIKAIGKKRYEDFKNHSISNVVKNLSSKAYLLYGTNELDAVKNRVKDAAKRIRNSQLIEIKNSDHDIKDENYFLQIKKIIQDL